MKYATFAFTHQTNYISDTSMVKMIEGMINYNDFYKNSHCNQQIATSVTKMSEKSGFLNLF